MNDSAMQLLYTALGQNSKPALWVLDEHSESDIPKGFTQLRALSNRIDTARALRQSGYDCELSDFEFLDDSAFERLYYRVSKEKAVVHHVINQALSALPLGGELCLFGFKNDGLKTYGKKAALCVGDQLDLSKGADNALQARIIKRKEVTEPLPDQDYQQVRAVSALAHGELAVQSKPGVFGWQKIDKGSALLVSTLPTFLAGFVSPPQTVVDLGCGYGYLSLLFKAQATGVVAEIIATDNSITALKACAANLPKAQTLLADAGDSLANNCADAVLCNPPFHSGFDHDKSLTDKFLKSALRLLKPKGRALFVVNQHIGIEQRAGQIGFRCERYLQQDGFKVLCLIPAK